MLAKKLGGRGKGERMYQLQSGFIVSRNLAEFREEAY